MAMQLESEQEAPVSSLVGGIVHDARKLLVEQLTLFKVEFKHDLQQTGLALIPLALGVVILLVALTLLGMGASHGLAAAMPNLTLWGAYLIVGAIVAVAGTLLTLWGKSMLAAVQPVDTALKGLEENVKWKTKN